MLKQKINDIKETEKIYVHAKAKNEITLFFLEKTIKVESTCR